MFKPKRFSYHSLFQQYYDEIWSNIKLSRVFLRFSPRLFLILIGITLVSSPFLASEKPTNVFLAIFSILLLGVFLLLGVYSLILNSKLSKEVKQLSLNEINQKTKMLAILFRESIIQIFHTVSLLLNLCGFFIASYVLQAIGFKVTMFELDFSFTFNAQLLSAIILFGALFMAIGFDINNRLFKDDA